MLNLNEWNLSFSNRKFLMNEVYEFRSCFALGNQARSPYSNSVTLGFNKSSQAYIIKMQVNSRYMSVNGQTLEVDPGFATAPTIINSRTMVPIRAVVEAMGGVAGWDGETRQVTLDANGVTVVMFIGSTSYYVSGHP